MSTTLRQATCVLVQGVAVLIEGEPGSGKSALALALIDRGAMPPPHTAGLIEVRNVGLVTLPCTQGPVGLLLRLDHHAPRYVDEAASELVCGVQVPVIALYPDCATLPLRAEWALRIHALQP
jgi:ABC-type glutathione transport system ATPase component